MSWFKKENEMPQYDFSKPMEQEEDDELNEDECNFETKDHICLLKSDKGKCDRNGCLLWRLWIHV